MGRARKQAKSKPAARKRTPAAKRRKATPKPKAQPRKPTPRKPAKAKAKPKRAPRAQLAAVPRIEATGGRQRAKTAREWSTRSSPVVDIVGDAHPIGALRRFLDSIKGAATEHQAQIALGAAQLLLLPMAREHRGGSEVGELVDLVIERWTDFGDRRSGFHAQEFLLEALAAVGVDRDRIARLEALVPPDAGHELLFALACAHAVSRDKVAMLRAVEASLDAGGSVAELRRSADFAPYVNDPDLAEIIARAELPAIPVDVEPYVPRVRRALDSLLAVLKELGGGIELHPPARLDAILDAERAAKLSLPNDYRALLAITNGMRLWDREFFATGDYREPTPVAMRARHDLHADPARAGCVPLASWGPTDAWLLYDPRGRLRGGDAGYAVVLDRDTIVLDDLAAALTWLEELAREVLGTN